MCITFVSMTGDQPSVRSCKQGHVCMFVSLTGNQTSVQSCRQGYVLVSLDIGLCVFLSVMCVCVSLTELPWKLIFTLQTRCGRRSQQ